VEYVGKLSGTALPRFLPGLSGAYPAFSTGFLARERFPQELSKVSSMNSPDQRDIGAQERIFRLTILGRTLEHLGIQMYKHRDAAIAELVANAWDAGASKVQITLPIPEGYDKATAEIVVQDDGHGMTDNEVEEMYLVLGRNRRADGKPESGRPVMGRKGIGKLAGFGMADMAEISTWREGKLTVLPMVARELTTNPGTSVDAEIKGIVTPAPAEFGRSGTKIVLRSLKHSTPITVDTLCRSLSRRFSRSVKGEMEIRVNGVGLEDPYSAIDLEHRTPPDGFEEIKLDSSQIVRYFCGFSRSSLGQSNLKGFSVLVRGKVAQAAPFFFNVEDVATAHHGTKYFFGEIEADFLDDTDDDVISTDRQEIDWNTSLAEGLRAWGEKTVKRALRDWNERQGERSKSAVLESPDLRRRLQALDRNSKKQAEKIFKVLGQSTKDPDRLRELAGSILRAFEYQHFHDFVSELEALSTNPDALEEMVARFTEWRTLESRAILEVIKGRVEVVDKFHKMVVNDFPETASSKSPENLHDLLGEFPWLINPEWQILYEEKSVTKTLREWNVEDDPDSNPRERYDFLALTDDKQLIVVDIKRPGVAVSFSEFQRLQDYRQRLKKGHRDIKALLIASEFGFDIDENKTEVYQFSLWSELHQRAKAFYNHYRALLEADIASPDFQKKGREVLRTRDVISGRGAHRPPAQRRQGLGGQDVEFHDFSPKA
jgi:histidine kinase/DNA gyrase B/HSP90-like ATPase